MKKSIVKGKTNEQKTILVTGGCGSIGSVFIRQMLESSPHTIVNVDALTYAGNPDNVAMHARNPRYHFVKCDIANGTALEKVFKKFKPQYVINFAAETHVDRSVHLGAHAFLRTNAEGVLTLLELIRRYPVIKMVQVSTDEVYGSLPLGVTERFNESSPIAPNSPYAASKAAGDLLCKAYHETWSLPVIITRCSNNFGPYHNPEKLIPFLVLRALGGQSLPLYGDGRNVRDWIYVEDHCRALALALFSGKPGEVYNIGSDGERDNLDIALRVARYFGRGKEALEFFPDRPGHDRRYGIDATKIREELGWRPQADFDTVCTQTIEWYAKNQAWVQRVFKRSGIFHPHIQLFKKKKSKVASKK